MRPHGVIIGVDFDNTIVCYDSLFHRAAADLGLIPADLPGGKGAIRDYLRKAGREDDWTELQGIVYGARMTDADAFPGAVDFFKRCVNSGTPVFIISPRTKHTYIGKKHDLHAAALEWLERNGFFDHGVIGLPRENVFFELSKADKLSRVAAAGCTHFIDDLPELLSEPGFPAGVKKILFAPGSAGAQDTDLRRAVSWADINNIFFPTAASEASVSKELRAAATGLLFSAGIEGGFEIRPIPGGANNRVYRAITSGGGDFLLKEYFQHPDDKRDRLGAEYKFTEFAWNAGARRIPKPVARDAARRIGLYEFIHGHAPAPCYISRNETEQALDFIRLLNDNKASPGAAELPIASEACFSIAEHLRLVGRRVEKLAEMDGAVSPVHAEAAGFVIGELGTAWSRIESWALSRAAEQGIDADAEIEPGDRCISPSDFGFHNAIFADDGLLKFIDFEYAGWDDPAKLVCDFFCQPAVPAPAADFDFFADAVITYSSNPEQHRHRIGILLPVYRIKWVCIMLNVFLGVGAGRRGFAGHGQEPGELEAQLDKAKNSLIVCIG